MVVGAVLDDKGRPICCDMWPGNKTDITTMMPVVDRLRLRFGIGNFCIVADRGMISSDTITKLEKRQMSYILGTGMRRVNAVFHIHGGVGELDNRDSFVERQPWEAFSRVGFRTVLNLNEKN